MAHRFDSDRKRRGRGRLLAALLLTMLAAVAWLAFWYRATSSRSAANQTAEADRSPGGDRFPLAELPPSEYLNTGAAARYCGSEQCRTCHEEAFSAYRTTGMGRSLDLLDPDQEPADVVFAHGKSGRQYRVCRRDGAMRHQELRLTKPGERELVLEDHAVRYVIGSGRHTRSYLLEIDGFMVESPLTWYTSQKAWGMSPGYDLPVHQGFSRAVDEGCVGCHSGKVRAMGGSYHRIQIDETWIGCERCHGPGSLHVERWSDQANSRASSAVPAGESDGKTDGAIDDTIVNPRHLDRKRSESICAQCHLRATAGVMARGRRMDDFRPGLPLDVFRCDYRLDQESSQMTVVGHVEQLRLSRCYQQSELTCTTCHNPHGFPKKTERVEYYRQGCLRCHSEEKCTVDRAVRERQSSDNNCLTCHMPTSDTEIPHLAFTHHRIGIHPARPGDEIRSRASGDLIALSDLSSHSPLDAQRMLGLAYMQASDDETDASRARELAARAYDRLRGVWNTGLQDVDMAAALAMLAGRAGDDAGEYVAYARDRRDVPGMVRVNVLLASAAWYAEKGEIAKAVSAMRDVVQLRRASGDWKLLGFLEERNGDHARAKVALEKAAEIDGHPPAWQPR